MAGRKSKKGEAVPQDGDATTLTPQSKETIRALYDYMEEATYRLCQIEFLLSDRVKNNYSELFPFEARALLRDLRHFNREIGGDGESGAPSLRHRARAVLVPLGIVGRE